jgi:hypothetical protein
VFNKPLPSKVRRDTDIEQGDHISLLLFFKIRKLGYNYMNDHLCTRCKEHISEL